MRGNKDGKAPLDGLTFCCTGINSTLRQEIASKITKLGGIHYSDLMSDVEYLIVGDRQTAKYRFCIKNRSDIKFIESELILSVYDHWLNGEDDHSHHLNIDEYSLPIFKDLNICFSRIEVSNVLIFLNEFRSAIPPRYFQFDNLSSLIERHGGKFSESLTLSNSCIVTTVASGRRYSKGVEWEKPIIHPIWIFDSILRGAALDFEDYILNGDSQFSYPNGCNIWPKVILNPSHEKQDENSHTKSTTENGHGDVSKKRLRSDSSIWNSIMDKPLKVQKRKLNDSWQDINEEDDELSANYNSKIKPTKLFQQEQEKSNKLFSHLHFLLVGFTQHQCNLLIKVIESNDGHICDTHDDTITHIVIPSKNGAESTSMTRILPADLKAGISSGSISVNTEWWIERAIFYNQIVNDNWGHPIKGLVALQEQKLKVCISGFTGIELLHVEKLLEYLGFEYCQTLTSQRDLLIINIQLYKQKLSDSNKELYEYEFQDILKCPISTTVSLVSTTNKINAATKWKIPIVSIAYIWQGLQLSVNEDHLILPEVADKRWCLFSPSEPSKLGTYIKSMNKNKEECKTPLMKLPSPRKPTDKKKYGRLTGTSLTTKLQGLNTEIETNALNELDFSQPTQIGYQEADNLLIKLDKPQAKTRAARKVGKYTK
jgi:DNA replication regulator DPB11